MDLKKYSVTVVAPSGPDSLISEKIGGINIRRFNYFYPRSLQVLTSGEGILYSGKKNRILGKVQMFTFILAEFFTALKSLMQEDFDIIHANWIIPQGFTAVLLGFIFHKKVVVTVHGTDVFALKKLNFIKAFILKYCDLCTANSSVTRDAVKEIYPKAKVEIAYMGVDVRLFNPLKRNKSWIEGFGNNPKIILGVGRLIKWKGFEYLIKAYAQVLKSVPNVKLVLIGKGPEEDALKKLASKLGLKENEEIFFMGTFGPDKLPTIYASSNLVVSPSITIAKTGEKEGQGNVVLEARASGVPVIASRSGGLVDTVDGKTNGLLFEERDYKELAKKIILILSDEVLKKRLSKNGLKYVRENFFWKKASARFCELYESILS
ncbi:MAG: glycosyltransferase family 4 protein [Candidatus Blackburnbacteria bacterium]|nr:glycosyltransferase family 4 protein [Candidatus Blackburnbacteria bacterium]